MIPTSHKTHNILKSRYCRSICNYLILHYFKLDFPYQMTRKYIFLLILLFCIGCNSFAQKIEISGNIIDKSTSHPIEYASILLKESQLWAVSNEKGYFSIKDIPAGQYTLIVRCLGYVTVTQPLLIDKQVKNIELKMVQDNLKLKNVEIVAKQKHDASTTTYTIDRNALNNQQIINISDLSTLLPGGKTINSTLMSNNRLALRSYNNERGNTSFGTAVEVDGVRIDNNNAVTETLGASIRNIGTTNIERVEIVSGIPSVEYGDLSNGIVKVHTQKGKTPFIVEGRINQHTQLFAANKGFTFNKNGGLLNLSFEHARSFTDAASPNTAYQRNAFTTNYMKIFMPSTLPLTLNVGLSGNIGGYHSKADPDNELNSYSTVRDYQLRGSLSLHWLLNKKYITNITIKGYFTYGDKLLESYTNTHSASAQAYIHTTQEGYFVAHDYATNPTANIILSPTGYWYVRSYNDAKPLTWNLTAKANYNKTIGRVRSNLMLGIDYTGSRNNGRGIYYERPELTPTFRHYAYKDLPTLNNLAFYIEERVHIPLSKLTSLDLTAGLRNDNTFLRDTTYPHTAAFSPRFKAKLNVWRHRTTWVSDLSLHAGWGKSVKLPSFQVLYPRPSYSDKLVFTPANTADNKSYQAFYTYPYQSAYNPMLKWQHSLQTDFGIEFTLLKTHISLSAFYNKTVNPYIQTTSYTPFAYKYTSQTALESIHIPSANRIYTIDQHTGIVTVIDKNNPNNTQQLSYEEKKTFLYNTTYTNASPIQRYGLEWLVDFAPITAIHTTLRLDGNYYVYKAVDQTLFTDIPTGLTTQMSNGEPYRYIGYYRGANTTSTSYSANAAVSNGTHTKQLNLNATVTTRFPKIRMIIALRIESSLYRYSRALSEGANGSPRGIATITNSLTEGEPYHSSMRNRRVSVFPEYFSDWANPNTPIPFAEKLAWAKKNDSALYNDLQKLIVSTNYPYTLNPNSLTSYFSANISITKEIGNHIQISFYANNFFNNMAKVHSSQTNLSTSLFGSGYIPSFYYGLALRLRI